MIKQEVILAKSSAIQKHLKRIYEKRQISLANYLEDLDYQESILFNIQMAVQNCIDLCAHIVSEKNLGIPGSTNEVFYLLEDNGYLTRDLTEKMVKALGFRNLIVHEYAKIDLIQVYNIAQKDIEDLHTFLKAILEKLKLKE